MRILRLTPAVEKKLLRAREERDREAERVAARIVGEVRRNGDAALARWSRKLDGVDLKRDGVWISQRELRAAEKQARPEFVRQHNVDHAVAPSLSPQRGIN